MSHILLINPKFPLLHQDCDHVMGVLGAKFIAPPLPLLTVAALIPDGNEVRLVDMNVRELSAADISWADWILATGIGAQAESLLAVCRRVKAESSRVKLVVGGLHVSVYPEPFQPYADAIVRGEAEEVLPELFADLTRGTLKPVYNAEMQQVNLQASPLPRLDLVKYSDYLIWTLQYARGCPYRCSFCEIGRFYGYRVREKRIADFMRELQAVYDLGFRGAIMFGDDNFHQAPQVRELLRVLATWQQERGYPFNLFTQTDIQLAQDPELMKLMAAAGFTSVQIGIESPSSESLLSVGKHHNLGSDLASAVRTIQKNGMEVLPAMLLGMDGDPPDIFERQFQFLTEAGTPRCMISLLRIFKGSKLCAQMVEEGRLLDEMPSGNQTGAFHLNFRAKMGNERLLEGAQDLLRRLYDPANYFDRCWTCVRQIARRQQMGSTRGRWKCAWNYICQIRCPAYNRVFRRFLLRVLLYCPSKFAFAFGLGVIGYHYYMLTQQTTDSAHVN